MSIRNRTWRRLVVDWSDKKVWDTAGIHGCLKRGATSPESPQHTTLLLTYIRRSTTTVMSLPLTYEDSRAALHYEQLAISRRPIYSCLVTPITTSRGNPSRMNCRLSLSLVLRVHQELRRWIAPEFLLNPLRRQIPGQ